MRSQPELMLDGFINYIRSGTVVFEALSLMDENLWPKESIQYSDDSFSKQNFMKILHGFIKFFASKFGLTTIP